MGRPTISLSRGRAARRTSGDVILEALAPTRTLLAPGAVVEVASDVPGGGLVVRVEEKTRGEVVDGRDRNR